ncbi:MULTISPECIES: nuclease-related domain-containing protein [unclassified Jeotgalibaca]|uniref:nuclease-related domain-containing protein n=1 Tax=unclassified Jeotgalibaca TaxID=2621505 RepID=UPI003FD1FF07
MRKKPHNLQVMEILHPRMPFTKEQERNYLDQQNGYEGEVAADDLFDSRLDNCIILNNLCLQGNRFCQIDKLIIAPAQIYLCEIKNYGGTFVYQNGNFYNHQMQPRDNPFLQLERTEQQLRSFTQGFDFQIQSRILTVNPMFQLHGSTMEMPLIQFGQLDRFVSYIAKDHQRLTSAHYELARYLHESHQTINRYEQLMAFDFGKLERGVFCRICENKMKLATSKKFYCSICKSTKTKQQAVRDAVQELQILFGSDKIKPHLVQNWTGNQIHRRNIQREMRRLENV